MAKIESFEKYSEAYDEWFRKNPDQYESELEAIRMLLPPLGVEGLEVGVGSGKFAEPLGIKIGVEPSGKMAINAETRGIKVYPGVAERLPFPDGRFGFVLMVTTICFVDDIMKSFSEAFRVLRHGGCIIVGFVDKDSKLGGQYERKRDRSRFYKDATFFSAPEVMKYLEKAGFKNTGIKQTLIPDESVETIRDGFGEGAFVVIRGVKNPGINDGREM